MRIHARTDLYVKALILLGFGTLAVAGALVDSRPDTSTLPDVPFPLAAPGGASVFTDVAVPGLASEASDAISLTLAQPGEPALRVRRAVLAAADAPVAPLRTAGPVRSSAPEAQLAVLSVAGVRGVPDLGFPDVTLAPVPDPADLAASSVGQLAEAATPNNQDEAAGMLSEFLRLTSASVGRTGASVTSSVGTSVGRAGNSVVGAFRFVSDTVKHVF